MRSGTPAASRIRVKSIQYYIKIIEDLAILGEPIDSDNFLVKSLLSKHSDQIDTSKTLSK